MSSTFNIIGGIRPHSTLYPEGIAIEVTLLETVVEVSCRKQITQRLFENQTSATYIIIRYNRSTFVDH